MIVGAGTPSILNVLLAAQECLKRKIEVLIIDNKEVIVDRIIKEITIGEPFSLNICYPPISRRKKPNNKKNIYQNRGWKNPYSK